EVGGQGLEAFAPGGQARFVPYRERGLQGVARGAQAVDQRRRLAFQSRRGRNQCRFVATGQRLGGGLLARERVGPGVGDGGAGGLQPRRHAIDEFGRASFLRLRRALEQRAESGGERLVRLLLRVQGAAPAVRGVGAGGLEP